jgi:hypothetical protein|uniref:Uncharacterized protein n=1 Tax=Siphoviridae sp. ctHEr2 TaxID=2826229 RepID=A0A8S5NFC3_9CAUD|nr:MAG TPA: hypothetical protein [Siphoviridae sp. ctHEr2]
MTPWQIFKVALQGVAVLAVSGVVREYILRDSRIAELEEDNAFLREQLAKERAETKNQSDHFLGLEGMYEELAAKYASTEAENEHLKAAQDALVHVPSKEETPSYEWVEFDDDDEFEYELKYNSSNGALYNGNLLANGLYRDLADLLYMEVFGVEYPTTAVINSYPRGSTRDTEPEEIRVTVYFDSGDSYGIEHL